MHCETTRCPVGFPASPFSWFILWALLAGSLCLAPAPVVAQIDASINQTVWKMRYGVTDAQINSPAWLAADDDGDGLSNGAELAAGTDPFSRSSSLGVSATLRNADGSLTLSFPTVPGKAYVLQSNGDLTNPAGWTTLVSPVQVVGDGTPKSLIAPAPGGSQNFYRVLVQDIDTDGDGVSDWAEEVTGFDPTTAHTNGATLDDHTALANDLAVENVVTVSAVKPTATQPAAASTAATDTARITLTRGGTLHFSAITVALRWSGTAVAGMDYAPLPSAVTFPAKVGSITLTVVPLFNPGRQTGATVTVNALSGGGYTVGAPQAASAVIAPAANPNGTGLTGLYFNGTQKTVTPYQPTVLFAGTPALTRLDPTLDFNWNSGSPGTGVNATYFGVRWQGQVQPQYSETYYFDLLADDGVKLWVNGQLLIDSWTYVGADRLGSIALQAGVLYDIKLEYYQYTGGDLVHLYWYSNSQPKQVIPSARLYPLTATPAPPAIVSAPTAVGFVNQPFSFGVVASTSGGGAATFALGSGSGPLPPGLTLNPATGLISGTPTAVGSYQVALVATNAYGTGAAVLNIQILNPGSGVTREIWPNLAGPNLSDLPLTTPPASTDNALTTLEDNAAYGNNTGERLRGYFIAPTTGNYYFWLAGSNAAELWVSDDAETVNLVRRAWVSAPGTGAESWNDANQSHQRSPWLALVAGQSYYYEVLHNTGGGGGTTSNVPARKATAQRKAVSPNASGATSPSNVAVGFLLDPTGGATTPGTSAVLPGYLLTQYVYPTATAASGTLYVTNLSPAAGVTSSAAGSAHLQLNATATQAILHFNYGGLSSPQTSYAVYGPNNNGTNTLLFDLNVIDKFRPDLKTPDGGYTWNIASSSAVSASTIASDIQQGKTYLVVETVNNPDGELTGNFIRVNGSQTPPTLVPDPGYTDDSATDAGAARFLSQAAFGAAPADVTAVQGGGYAAWINYQLSLPATHLLPSVQAQARVNVSSPYNSGTVDNAWWQAAVTAPDQLRQRVAFALSEIMVVSDTSTNLVQHSDGLASYYDTLSDHAFGNFRDLLEAVTLHPTMGVWLNLQGNAAGNLATGYHPNENYAREVMQLFSIGLNRLWPDGSLVLDSTGDLVPTYTQDTITNGLARVFTGWTWHQALQGNGQLPTNFYPAQDFLDPMTLVKKYHELGTKNLLDNVVLPAAVGYSPTATPVAGSQADPTTAAYDSYCLADLETGLDAIFNHPNFGPFICRQLIQRLVESNPSPAYLYRVVAKFNDDGTGAHVRGNLAAVLNAILLDGEARNAPAAAASATAGKQREPLLRITGPARTFLSTANSGTYSQSGGAVMTITTANPHHYSAADLVGLDFTVNATGTPPSAPLNNPTTGSYQVLSTPAPTTYTFAVAASSLANVSCAEAANTNTLTVNTSGPPVGEKVYLKFITGGFTDGVYVVASIPASNSFTVTVGGSAPTAAVTGTVLVPKDSGVDTITNPAGSTVSTITVGTNSNSNVNVGDHVWLVWSGKQLTDSEWVVASVIDERNFTVASPAKYNAESTIGLTMYPLVAPPLARSGNVGLPSSKFDMGNTNSLLAQTPLDAPTVFNFFYPDYQYPGSLATNGVTAPEFQLTTDSNVVALTNTVASTILSSGNTNGLSSFKSGSINLDLSAYLGAPYVTVSTTSTTSGTKVTAVTTTTVNATALVNKLGDLLTGGMLSQQSKDLLTGYLNNAANFPPTVTVTGTTTAPPPAPTLPTTSARDRVRAAVEQILDSPEYAIQR